MPGAEPYASGMAVLAAEIERQMPDTCQVTRPAPLSQTPVLDPVTLEPVEVPAEVVYEGPCTIADPGQFAGRQNTINDEAGVPVAQSAKFPYRADLRPGDLITITSAAYLPGMVGDVFVVFDEEARSFGTYRRYLLRGSSWQSAASGT